MRLPQSRRNFLRSMVACSSVWGAPTLIPGSALGLEARPAPSDRIVMGSIGVGGLNPLGHDNQGSVLVKSFMQRREVQVAAVCDADASHRLRAQRYVEERYGKASPAGAFKGCSVYRDFREILRRADMDAVIIALPDHWHAIPVILAARAHKDIYAEKPLALTVAEGRAMVDEVQRSKVVFQTGSQLRSVPWMRRGCELVRNGRIGKVHTVRGVFARAPAIGPQPDMPVPEGFDYDRWLGPAPAAPYTEKRCHFNFRWIWDYSGGQVTDHGAHYVDLGQWGLGTERSGPVEVEGKGVFPREGLFNVATAYHIEWTYANGVKFTGDEKGRDVVCVTFEGTEGSVHIGSRLETKPAALAESVIGPNEFHLPDVNDHHGNFLECIRTRKTPLAPIEDAHRSAAMCHIGNIAMKLGRKLRWDTKGEQFLDDPEANRMLSRPMRSPYTLKEME